MPRKMRILRDALFIMLFYWAIGLMIATFAIYLSHEYTFRDFINAYETTVGLNILIIWTINTLILSFGCASRAK